MDKLLEGVVRFLKENLDYMIILTPDNHGFCMHFNMEKHDGDGYKFVNARTISN